MSPRRTVGYDENDAFTGWRFFINWRPGRRAAIKSRARRRERREGKADIRKEQADG